MGRPCVFADQRPAPTDAFSRSDPAVGVHSRRERDEGLGLPYPIGGNAVGATPVSVALRPPSDADPVLAGTGAVRLRFRQHDGVTPLVHQVGHRHLAPAVVPRAIGVLDFRAPGHAGRRCARCRRPGAGTGRAGDRSGYGVEQGRGSDGAALPVEAGGRNRPVPTWVRTGTLVRASASTVQHPEFPGSSGLQRVPGAGNYDKPPSTRPERTAQITICCLVLKPSFFWTPDTALRTVSGLTSLTSPIS